MEILCGVGGTSMKMLGYVWGAFIENIYYRFGGTKKESLKTFILEQGKHVVIGSIEGCRFQFAFLPAYISPPQPF
jgi:hypothetical protein